MMDKHNYDKLAVQKCIKNKAINYGKIISHNRS